MITFDHVFAVPGAPGIVDAINPTTGLSACYGENLEQVQVRYPGAVQMSWSDWQTAAIRLQQTPIIWEPSTQDAYNGMLGCLPPIDWRGGAFLVGEPCDHDHATGRPRYQAYWQIGTDYFASSRPVTRAELRAIVR